MLPGLTTSPAFRRRPSAAFADIVGWLALSTNLKLCLDAGASDSFTSGQKWLDVSGNGHDFFRGTDGSAQASDPSFSGTAGNLSANEYFSFDGGDYFTYDATNETWMTNLHKDNAVWTWICWFWSSGDSSGSGLIGSNGASGAATTGPGFLLQRTGGGFNLLQLRVTAASTLVLQAASSASMTTGAWNFLAVSIDEGAATGALVVNNTTTNFTSTYASPSTAGAAHTLQIGSRGNAANPAANTDRMAIVAMWEGVALNASQLSDLRLLSRQRYGV